MLSSDNAENVQEIHNLAKIREKYPFLVNYFSKGIENPDKNDMGKKGREIYLRQFTISKFEERLNEILLHSVPK